MATIETILDQAQEKLHDSGTLWSRNELLRWFNNGYEEFLRVSACVRRFAMIDVPPRYAFTYTHEWEVRFTNQGPSRMMAFPALNAKRRCTALWEVQHLEGVTPSAARVGLTQDWERSHQTDVDHHFIFALPQNHEIVLRVAWDHKKLFPVTVRELDSLDTGWMRLVGEPRWWTNGTGRINSVEVFEVRTDYGQAYAHWEYEHGVPRGFDGSRTYAVDSTVENGYAYTTSGDSQALTLSNPRLLSGVGSRVTRKASDSATSFCMQTWEEDTVEAASTIRTGGTIGTYRWEYLQHGADAVSFGVGTIRSITSADRWYWAQNQGMSTNNMLGIVRGFASSEDAVEVTEVVVPDVDLQEEDSPDLLPTQAQKYLRFYVLSRAFGRTGPGQNFKLAGHYEQRFERGVQFFKKLADVAYKDHVYTREMADDRDPSRVSFVRFPSTFESVW